MLRTFFTVSLKVNNTSTVIGSVLVNWKLMGGQFKDQGLSEA